MIFSISSGVVHIKIGFVSRHNEESIRLVEVLADRFRSKADIFVEPEIAQKIGIKGTSVEEMEKQRVDFIVSVGGDGTILRTIHRMNDPVPILGISMSGFQYAPPVLKKPVSRDFSSAPRGHS